jgi:glutathione peroxidase
MSSVFDFEAKRIDGTLISLREFEGQVILIVNTASECGFTPQYQGLQELYQEYQPRGLAVLGFPCNQFGKQEPGSTEEITQFCEANYGVRFPMFAKVEVNGAAAHPLFRWLKREARGLLGSQRIKWNFTKFLVDRKGHVVRRFAPRTKPQDLRRHIERLL